MKKLFLTIMVISMTLVLTACGSKKAYLGLWKYKVGSLDYTVELQKDGKFVMKQGDASREGTYTVKEENGYTLIDLNYNNTHGYMKLENNVMCAWESEKCSFNFEKVEDNSLVNNK